MILPNEITLDVLHFLDYSPLLRAKFTCSKFLRVIVRNQEILASTPKLCLIVKHADVWIDKIPVKVPPSAFEWRDFGSLDAPLAVAVATAASNPIVWVNVTCKAVATGAVDKVLSVLPAANYASDLCIRHIDDVRLTDAQLAALLAHFRELQSISLEEIPEVVDWTILRSSCLLRLTHVYLHRTDYYREFSNDTAQAELIRFLTDFSPIEQCKPKVLTLDWLFSKSFAMKIVQVRAMSFRITVFFFSYSPPPLE